MQVTKPSLKRICVAIVCILLYCILCPFSSVFAQANDDKTSTQTSISEKPVADNTKNNDDVSSKAETSSTTSEKQEGSSGLRGSVFIIMGIIIIFVTLRLSSRKNKRQNR